MCYEGVEGTLFGQPRAMPGTALLHSVASKNGLQRSSPPLRVSISPSLSHKADMSYDARRDPDTWSRHRLSSLHPSAASSRNQLVIIL